jgi:hypothetical protein
MIGRLDPLADDADITHLTMEVLTPPFMAHLGYASGAARTVASPRIAERATRQGTGDQLVRPRARNVDTLTFFSELFRFGHRSPEGIAASARIQAYGPEPRPRPHRVRHLRRHLDQQRVPRARHRRPTWR